MNWINHLSKKVFGTDYLELCIKKFSDLDAVYHLLPHNSSYDRAKEIFIEFNGDHHLMWHEGSIYEYSAYDISEEDEKRWSKIKSK